MKLVHWPLMGVFGTARRGLGGAAAGPGPVRCTKCNSPPINGQCINHRIAVLWSAAVPIKFGQKHQQPAGPMDGPEWHRFDVDVTLLRQSTSSSSSVYQLNTEQEALVSQRGHVMLHVCKQLASILHCVPKKTCDHIFDDKLKQNYHFTKIFGTLITKSIRHRQVYLVSHLTHFVHLLYLGKLSRPKYHEFSLKFLNFSMLQCQDINCKIVTILFCLHCLSVSETGYTIGFKQQLSTTSFEACELEITVNYFSVYT